MVLPKTTFLKILLSLIFLVYFPHLYAQQSLPAVDSIPLSKFDQVESDSMIPVGYDFYKKNEVTSAIASVSSEAFNRGLISDPALLIQGKMAGVQIYNRGGDPNLLSLIRIRGLSGYSQRNPLIVVDGIAGAFWQNLDPNDIASITVLKDGSAQAIYGIRASNGVILVQTKDGQNTNDRFSVSYKGQAAVSTAYPTIPVMSADEFRAVEGITDLGASTNWMDEVERMGFSNIHGLAMSGKLGTTTYRISGNYRNVEGILQKSGFEQLNTRANLSSTLMDEALFIQLSASYTDRNSQLGFNEAFRYAISTNPTAPVRAEDAPFAFNTEKYGGFFETLGLFDSFNPKAIVDLNDRNGKLQVLSTAAFLRYDIKPALSLNFRYAYQDLFANERAYYPPQSYFRGNPFFVIPERSGRADLNDYADEFSLYEVFTNYKKTLGKSKLGLSLGYAYQDGNYLQNDLRLYGFSNEEVLEVKRIEDYQTWMEEAMLFDTVNIGWSNKLAAFFGRMNFNLQDKLIVNASLRYEGSSKLGENKRWGFFPGLGMALNLDKMLDIPAFEWLKIRAGYGITGSIPQTGGLSQAKIVLVEQDDGSFIEEFDWVANPDLKWEEKREVNLGLDFRIGQLEGHVDWYNRSVTDWINRNYFDFSNIYVNQNALNSTGVELNLSLRLFENQKSAYHTGIFFSTFQTKFGELEISPSYAVGVGGFVQNPPIGIQEEEPIGDIFALIFQTVNIDGGPEFEDINQDGNVVTDIYGIFEPESDFRVVGNGLPNFELGWSNHFRLGDWHIQAFFRGAFGHSLVNRARLFFEPRQNFSRNNFNFVDTELAEENLRFSRFSSLYVENASFLKLDNLSLSRSFPIGAATNKRQLNVSLTGQNLFVITNYTGPDPEPVLEDIGGTDNGGLQNALNEANPFAPGIDRRNNYLPSRTIVIGIGLEF